ncbi:hypothetical protein H6G91_38715 [Nostoc muscorum FACHB-395]|nr:hypothetical protein [Desmonostoc muscorum FACHB-395]
MFQKYLRFSFLTLLVLSNLFANVAIAASIEEDKLDTVNGVPWGGDGLPFNKVVDIKDALVNSALGKVVIDRHGEDPLGVLFQAPFAAPSPGRFVLVSFWGSKVEGCFVKIIVQSAPASGEADLENLVPKMIELGINGQVLRLDRSPKIPPRGFKGNYTYTQYENNTNVTRSSTWFMTDTSFTVNGDGANFLRTAPPKEIKARVTFSNGDSKVFPIGSGNVKRWDEAFGFNSSCSAPK